VVLRGDVVRPVRRAAFAVGVALGVVVLAAAPAWAHVTVNPDTAQQGGFQTLTFQVPNEMDNANTIELDVQLPADHPFASVSVQPKAGWTYEATKSPLPTPVTNDDGQTVTDYVSEIKWTGGQIKPGEFDTFSVSVGTLPDNVDSLAFPAVQTYDNGQTVSWIDSTVEDQPEPEHPAPVLHLTAAAETGSGSQASSSSSSASTPAVSATVVKKESNNGLAIVALIVGAIGLIIGIVALVRGRGSPASA
jgi:uncharacterized protein YcnI